MSREGSVRRLTRPDDKHHARGGLVGIDSLAVYGVVHELVEPARLAGDELPKRVDTVSCDTDPEQPGMLVQARDGEPA